MRIGTDKWAHYGLSAVATLVAHIVLDLFMLEALAAGIAAVLVLIVGTWKELYSDETPEVMDLVANVLGVITAILIIIFI